jgi:molybdopterin-synthase adenylyltransferase
MSTDRYARHQLIDWFDQDLIRSLQVIVVGAGAIGNEVIKNLALLGVGTIHVFDLDKIEASNLTRSVLFREDDIGREKAECAAARAQELDPAVTAFAHHGDFWKTLSFSLLQSSAVVFGCLDNFEARIRLNRLCAIAKVPLVNTGIDSRFGVVELFRFDTSENIGCYECGLPAAVYASVATRYSCGWLRRVGIAEKRVPTTVLTASGTASFAVSAYLRSLVAAEPEFESIRLYHDSFTGHSTRTVIERAPGCPGCGDLLPGRMLLSASRDAMPTLTANGILSNEETVLFSDRVLTHIRCQQCDGGRQWTPVFRASDDFDESVLKCPTCDSGKREVGLADRVEIGKLRRDYKGLPWPGKFAIYQNDDLQLIVELLGGQDARRDSDPTNGR